MKTLKLLFAVLPVLLAGSPAGAAGPDWHKYEIQSVSLLRDYLRIDNTNPPGNEAKAADFLVGVLKDAGIPSSRFEFAPGRSIVYARLKGTGEKRPLLLTHHMDTVPADSGAWTVPPFSGELKDGEIWGLGAIDMKTTGILHLMMLKMASESGKPLARDLIFLAVGDEEEDSAGMRWFLKNKSELIADAEFALNEGGTIKVEKGHPDVYQVSTVEKAPLWLELTAEGAASHASEPASDPAVDRLLRALDKITRFPRPVKVIPSVELYFAQLGHPDIKKELLDPAAAAAILGVPYNKAILTNTISITQLKASDKINTHPNRAQAWLDCRLLPGEAPEDLLAGMKKAVSDEKVTFRTVLSESSKESSPDSALFRAIRKVAAEGDPGAIVMPMVLTSSTDSHYLRDLGIAVYGFEPYRLAEGEERSHANDERISAANVNFGLRFLFSVIQEAGK
ncbi:MAG: M20/M25/M40 family metallo-hydrolase [Elusimicrobiota bacterium]|nr:M20/M25/M40 family metallo-hydrolase [Elusimicrobiota bacterium]